MQSVILNLHPELKRLVMAVAPSYRKHKVYIKVSTQLRLSGTFWDGGSRSTYWAVRLSDGFSLGAPQYDPATYGGPREAPIVTIPVGVAIVEVGISCGKTATASITLHQDDATKLLT